jgi:hypothetical protein
MGDDLAEHEQVVAAAERIPTGEHGEQLAVRIIAGCLVGARAIEAPVRQGCNTGDRAENLLDDVRLEHFGLRAKKRRRLGAVDPDVFGLYDTHRYYSYSCSRRRGTRDGVGGRPRGLDPRSVIHRAEEVVAGSVARDCFRKVSKPFPL